VANAPLSGTLPKWFRHIKDGKPAQVKEQHAAKGRPQHKKAMSAQAAAEPDDVIAMATEFSSFTKRFNAVLAAKAMQKTENRLPTSLTKQPTVLPSATTFGNLIDLFQTVSFSTFRPFIHLNDRLIRFVVDDNAFDAFASLAHDTPSISLITASGIQYGKLLEENRHSSILFSSIRDHTLSVPQLLANVDTGSHIHLWTLDAALKYF
jgi:hypothetical protein